MDIKLVYSSIFHIIAFIYRLLRYVQRGLLNELKHRHRDFNLNYLSVYSFSHKIMNCVT